MIAAMVRPRASDVEVHGQTTWRLVAVGAMVLVRCDPARAGPGFSPMTVGDTWTYRTTQQASVPMPGATATERVVSTTQDGARRVARIVSEDASNPQAGSERSQVVTAAGVLPDVGTMTTAIGPVTTVRSEGVFLPAELTPGLRWTYAQELDSPISTMSVTGAGEVVGIESVRVPAGRFEAVRVRSEVRNHVVVKDGAVPPIDHVQRDECWYVRGLGLVRSVTESEGYRAEKLLVAFAVRGAPAPATDDPLQIAVDPP
jgi:hypothetical protein